MIRTEILSIVDTREANQYKGQPENNNELKTESRGIFFMYISETYYLYYEVQTKL